MKCKKCGGNLKISDGVYLCEACGAKYSITDYYEDIDAYICYVESDHAGRRTKDSIIAQDLYQKLEANKIKSFYSRVSASDLTGELYEKACNAALFTAKTVIIIGSSKENFESLVNHYESLYTGKIVIPVFSEMNPYDIPKNISAIQALDYNKIGSDIDLIKSILNALGRTSEADLLTVNNKHTGKKQKKIVLAISVIAVVMAVAGFLIFGTDLVFKKADEAPVEQQLTQYNEAVACMEDGKYARAIELFYNLTGYKDSDRQLQILYERYAGYYKDDASGVTIHFQILDGNTANIDITSVVDGKQIRITESSLCQATKAAFDFNDSENNQGTVYVQLNDNDLSLDIKTETIMSDLTIGDLTAVFQISDKSDQPFSEEISADTLLGFIENKTTLGNLKQRGFDIVFVSALYKDTGSSCYKINNTDIQLAIFNFDISKSDEFYGDAETSVDDPIVFGVSAPAETIIPDYVGKTNDSVVINDVLYVPDGNLGQNYHVLDFGIPSLIEKKEVSKETNICFTSKELIGQELFDELVDYYCISGKVIREYQATYPEAFPSTEILEDTNTYRTISVYDYKGNYPMLTYKINTQTFQIKEISDDYNSTLAEENMLEEEYDPALEEGPNVWCPNCGHGFYTTGIGNDGLTCSECGCIWLPMCNVCHAQDAVSIKSTDNGQFVCNLCGGTWNP